MRQEIIVERVEDSIYMVRGVKVMLDIDLAALYGVSTKRLNQQVHRNARRFPQDFMFQLSAEEVVSLRLQFETSKKGRGGRRYLPYVFTEQGVAMLSGVLNSGRAVRVNIAIMRAFVNLRRMRSMSNAMAKRLDELEKKYSAHDGQIGAIFGALRELMDPPEKPKRRIGFK